MLSLTPEGGAFLPYAGTLLETQDQALATLSSSDSGLSGILKVTAPNVIGHSIVVPTAAELLNENPSLRVDLTLTDGVVDIVASGLDIAIRVAPLQASNLIATRLADNPRVLCASPAYIRKFGKPFTIGDLTGHSCLLLHGMDDWPFVIDGKLQRVLVSGRFAASTIDAIRAACISGSGLALMTYWDVWNELDLGRLEQIELADAVPDELGIWGILPSRSYTPRPDSGPQEAPFRGRASSHSLTSREGCHLGGPFSCSDGAAFGPVSVRRADSAGVTAFCEWGMAFLIATLS